MPLMTEPLVAFFFTTAFLSLVAYAAASDVATMTIPNWVSVAIALLYPVGAWLAGEEGRSIALHLALGLGLFAIGFGLFAAGVLGGGDVKVIAAVSLWTGLEGFASFTLGMAITGGVLAAAAMVARRAVSPNPSLPYFINRFLTPRAGIPYAVAIAGGVLFSLSAQPLARLAFF